MKTENQAQLQIDFTTPVKRIMNNTESQIHANNNELHFSDQCKRIYDYMLSGKRISSLVAVQKLAIVDCRKRISELRKLFNVPVKSVWVDTKKKKKDYKEYYLELTNNGTNQISIS